MPRPDIMGRRSSESLEQDHVYSVYDQIAPCFSEISQKAWPNVRRFLKRLQPGSLVADIGCGNGRYLHINKHIFKIGLDICCPLVESARKKGHEVLVADNLRLPFRSGLFDAVISVGVIHHISTTERRIEAVRELARILRPGGQMMLYVWAYEQKHRRFDGQDVLIPWHGGQKTSKSGLLPSCSDKDLSSVSSISEDESSADTSDFTFNDNTLQRTASETFKDTLKDTLQELDNVFWTDNTVPKVIIRRQRSNTLPNLHNGQGLLHPPEEKRKLVVNRSVLAEECRRIEASMKALSVSHNHQWYDGKSSDITGQGLEGDGEGSDITEDNDSHVLNVIHSTSYACKTRNISLNGHAKHQNSPSQKRVLTKLASTKTYLSSDSIVEPINAYHSQCHVAKNVKVKSRDLHSVVHKQIPENSINKTSINSSKSEIKKESEKKEEVSFFNLIKAKIKKVFDIEPPPKPLESPDVISKSLAVENWLLHSFGGDGALGNLSTSTSLDEFEGFAVREFPQSSRPSNRNSVDITGELDINGQAKVTSGVITMANEPENGLSQSSVNGHSKGLESKPRIYHKGSNGHMSSDKDNLSYQSQMSGNAFVCTSKNENSVQCCEDNQNRCSDLSSNSGPTNHIKSRDLRRGSHDCTTSNGSCDQYGAFESLCRVTDKDLSGNNGQSFVIGEFSKGETILAEDKTTETKTGIRSKSLQTLNGYCNDTTESCQPKCVSTGKKPESQDSSGECDVKQLSRYYHVFREGELIELITNHVHSLRVVSNMFDHSNWCVVVEKR
ncbi:uncharacterized protein LOC117329102 [Pecten maximus]|uniref:uncharacterized protein LOC117329102 n=1 Tax=Pecten maximus TaxID=6579 RepID=UPI001458C660|nr:uncharacterized protein LOC117329102 [Pecten maximus]